MSTEGKVCHAMNQIDRSDSSEGTHFEIHKYCVFRNTQYNISDTEEVPAALVGAVHMWELLCNGPVFYSSVS